MNIRFIASVSVIARDPVESRKLYVDTLGLPLEPVDGDYYASEHVEGSKHFGVWPPRRPRPASGPPGGPPTHRCHRSASSSSWKTQTR